MIPLTRHHNIELSTRICGLLLLFAALLLLSVLTISVIMSDREVIVASYWGLQTNLFIQLNARLSHWPLFWQNVTELGDALVLLAFLSFYILRYPQVWVGFFAAIPLTATLSVSLKYLVAMPRPAAVLAHDKFNVVGNALSAHNSFPSGHAITVFAIVTVIIGLSVMVKRDHFDWYCIIGGTLFASLVALSRLAVGAHWPMDIAAGACLGVMGGSSGVWIVQRYPQSWRWLVRSRAQTVTGYIMILWGVLLLVELLVGGRSDVLVSWIASLCVATTGIGMLFRPVIPRVIANIPSWRYVNILQQRIKLLKLRDVKQIKPGMVEKWSR